MSGNLKNALDHLEGLVEHQEVGPRGHARRHLAEGRQALATIMAALAEKASPDRAGLEDWHMVTPGEFCEFCQFCQFCGATGMDLDIRACPSGEDGEFHNADLSETLRDILRISEGRDDDHAELLVGRWIITHPEAVERAKGVIKKTASTMAEVARRREDP